MNCKPMWARQLRRASGVAVVAASTLALGLPLSGVASAAASAISAQPAQPNYAAGETATIDVTTTGTPANLEVTVLSGPDASYPAPVPGSSCQAAPAGSSFNYTCTFTNTGGAGTDQVRVYDAPTAGANFAGGDTYGDTSVTFAAAPYSLSLAPSTNNAQANTCTTYTVTATDQQGRAAADYNINLTATEPTGTNNTATPLQFCAVTGGQTPTGQTNANSQVAGSNPAAYQDTLTGTVKTDGTGKAVFGLQSAMAGTVSLTAKSGGATATATETVVGGKTGNDSVAKLTVTPTSTNDYTGTTENFTVTALDSDGNPVSGATVYEDVTSGPDTAGNQPTAGGPGPSCGTTGTGANNGQVTCSLTNNGTAGTDDITFYVNNASSTTFGPDSGEPQATATATFTTPPTVNVGNSSVTCPDQTNSGAGSGTCTIPTSQKTITFTATVKDNNNNPVSGAVVDWTTGGSATAANATPRSGTSTTNAQGVATYTVTDSAPANGDTVSATAKVGNTTLGTATATYATPVATNFTLTPSDQTVQNGGTVTVTATVTDQFGNPVSGDQITWSVTGRNNGKTGTVTTGSDGTATISYTDSGTAGTTDTITATDAKTGTQAQATVHYTTGSATASTVTVATNGVTFNGTCPTTTSGSATNNNGGSVENGNSIPVCAHVVNSTGEVLSGKSVTFTVDKGFVTKTSTQAPSTDTQSVTVTTDVNGNAYAYVYSHTSGTQTVTATADSATGSGTVAYSSGNPRNVAVVPPTTTIAAGQSQKFTATVTDLYGNPVPNVYVSLTQSGPGAFTGQSSTSGNTDANGQISATLTTQPTDSGNGTVTADISNAFGNFPPFNECQSQAGSPAGAASAGNCSATANYTVSQAPQASDVTISPASATVTAGHSKKFTATVTDSTGTPVSGVTVNFAKSGPGALSTTSATTGANGNVIVTLATSSRDKGAGTIVATINGSNTSCGTSSSTCSTTATYNVKSAITKIHPGLTLRSPRRGVVTVTVSAPSGDRGARVTIHVSDNGSRTIHTTLGRNGKVTKTLHYKPHTRATAYAYVAAHGHYSSGTTRTKHIWVHQHR